MLPTESKPQRVNFDFHIFESVVDKSGAKVAKVDEKFKYVCLYFSAHWCPPCKAFTPKLVAFYDEHHTKKEFEVIFVSADRDKSSFDEYYKSMPWLHIEFDSDARDSAMNEFDIDSIPRLLIIDTATKEIVCKDGYFHILKEKDFDNFPWTAATDKQSAVAATPTTDD